MATRQQFLAMSEAKPFAPFTLCLVSGTQFTVNSPAGASVSDDGLELAIHTLCGDRLIDMRLVEIVEPAVSPIR
jgi:hypothetical protein